MKTDRTAADVAFSAEDLADHFARLAFGAEYTIVDGRYTALPANNGIALKRWAGPLAYRVSGNARPTDRLQVDEIAARLSNATGLTIAPAGPTPNVQIRFLDAEGRAALAERHRDDSLGELIRAWSATPEWPCASEFYARRPHDPRAHQIIFAVIYIRDELDGLTRRACIEEEFAQILGLARDDPTIRPSIFNDDDEYALLTDHDALLLRILYDPALREGMMPPESAPVVRDIARRLRPANG